MPRLHGYREPGTVDIIQEDNGGSRVITMPSYGGGAGGRHVYWFSGGIVTDVELNHTWPDPRDEGAIRRGVLHRILDRDLPATVITSTWKRMGDGSFRQVSGIMTPHYVDSVSLPMTITRTPTNLPVARLEVKRKPSRLVAWLGRRVARPAVQEVEMSRKKRPAEPAPPPAAQPLLARSPDPLEVLAPPSDITDGPTPILEAVKLAGTNGHKVDRRGPRLVECWHCDMSGILLINGERSGNIFTDRCPGIVRRGA